MTRVHVTASRAYEVTIGRGLLASVGQTAAGLWKGRTAAVVSDTHVAPLYLDQVKASLEGAGFQVHPFVFPAGEEHKNGATYLNLLAFLAQAHLTRVCRRHLPPRDCLPPAAHHPVGGGGRLRGGQDRHRPGTRQEPGGGLLPAPGRPLRPGHPGHPPRGRLCRRLRRGHQVRHDRGRRPAEHPGDHRPPGRPGGGHRPVHRPQAGPGGARRV